MAWLLVKKLVVLLELGFFNPSHIQKAFMMALDSEEG